jgi:tetratricopeptide (TPR) repeat protein
MDYTAVGQTTHLAARMEQLARPGTVLMTADTLRLCEGYVEVNPLGPVPIKGLGAPVDVYEILRAGPARSRLQAAAARGLTRFVGRIAEMEALRQAMEGASAGHGQVVAVVGEPGVGKSRLFWEFTHSHRTRGWLGLATASVSYGKATPYLPVIELLRTYFQIGPRDDGRRIREKATGKLLTLDRALEPALPALLALLDVPTEDSRWDALDPPQRRQRTLEALKRLLLRESQVQPLILVFEDLHWIDGETQMLLDSVVESLPTARVLLLVNYRPEYRHAWGGKTYYTQLRIDPLPPESAGELLETLLGGEASVQPLKRLLIERTEGNPFFLEESVRTLVETQALAGERGAYRAAKPLATMQVPASVQAVLAARIDRLPPQDKRLLQSAAVVGKDVPFVLLQAVAGHDEDALRRGLARLQAAEFLYETTLFPDLEYTFKHALTHEVAHGSLLHEQRRGLHIRIVKAIERTAPDRLAEHIDRLAHHAFRGEAWEKAFNYLRQAGGRAWAHSAYREALASFEQALTALPHLPESRERLEQDFELRLELRLSLNSVGRISEVLEHLRHAEEVARRLGDRARLGTIANHMSNQYYFVGALDDAVEAGERARGLAVELDDASLLTNALIRLAEAYSAMGELRRAIDLFARAAAEPASALGIVGPLHPVLPLMHLAHDLAELGRFAEADARAEEAVRTAEPLDHPWSLTVACGARAGVDLLRGEFDRSIIFAMRGLDLCRTADLMFTLSGLAVMAGSACAHSGRTAEGIALLEEGVRADVAMGRRGSRLALRLSRLGEAYLLAGRVEDAANTAHRAMDLPRGGQERRSHAWILRLLAEIAAQPEPPQTAEAEARYREAIELAGQLEMRPLIAHCYLGLGKLYRRTDRRPEAQANLTTATTMYREMDMRFWLEQAEAERAALG